MQTVFPDQTGYAGMFVIGFRKRPDQPGQTQRVGTVVLKRTYDIAATGTLSPSPAAHDVFAQDIVRPGPGEVVQYESDVTPFKPNADPIVLGFIPSAGANSLRVDGQTWLSRTVVIPPVPSDIFGWEPRTSSARMRGSDNNPIAYSDSRDDYPPEWPIVNTNRDPLPSNFSNRFFCGFNRGSSTATLLARQTFPPSAGVQVIRPGANNDYAFALRGDVANATLRFHGGTGPDSERRWQRREITMRADTLVVEPDVNRCYLVWRGIWDFDDIAEVNLRRLDVVASA